MKKIPLLFSLIVSPTLAVADSSTLDAAIGGGIGGAAGAALGNELGGRDGAIVGSALGAAVGTAVNTDVEHESIPRETRRQSPPPSSRHRSYHFCPPGQAKKGRC